MYFNGEYLSKNQEIKVLQTNITLVSLFSCYERIVARKEILSPFKSEESKHKLNESIHMK